MTSEPEDASRSYAPGARAPSVGPARAGSDRRLLEAVFDNATVAMFLMDERQQCIYMNPAAERLTGFSLAEVRGRPLHDIIHHTRPDGSPYPLEECPIDRAFPENNREQGEEVFVHKDGSFYPVAYTASPLRDEGSVVGTIIEVRDVSAEKRARQEALESAERVRFLADAMPQKVWTADQEGNADYFNQRWIDYTGLSLDELRGWGWKRIVHPDDWPGNLRLWRRSIDTGEDFEMEHRFLRADGTYHWHLSRGLAQRDETGAVRMWVGTDTDIDEQKQTEAALREAHLLLEAALSAGGVLAWVWDIPRDRLRGSATFARLFSVDPEGATQGLPLAAFVDAIHEDDRPRVLEAVARAVETGELYAADYRVHAADGRLRWVAVRGHVEYDAAGEPVKFPGVLVDITERKEAEEERERLMKALTKAHDEMEQRVEERTAQLKQSNEELESFAYSISHDLRTPLRGIAGFSQVLQEDYGEALDETARSHLQRIRAGAERMGHLIDDLLNLSRLSRSRMERQRVDLSALVEGVVEGLRAEEPGRQVEVGIQEGVTATGDPRLLKVALENVLSNAWKFTRTRERPRVEFGVREEGGESVYFVRDNGAGFDMRYADKLFTPFQRLHAEEEFAGTGIGLATVQRIIRRHGGRIWAESEPDGGATFSFTLVPDPTRL